MDPKLAVIVPAYNVSQYLEDCVKSIVNQSYTNWEMVIINDGSMPLARLQINSRLLTVALR